MPETEERLSNCFAAVFPELSESEIPRASHTSVANWDSLATVTLISVLEEEFQVTVAPEEFEYVVSYELILELLRSKGAHV